jgi:hypothetical protein
MIIEKDHIICGRCNLKFEREGTNKHCSNCFACTGCEIYYCPLCDEEIIITPVRTIRKSGNNEEDRRS